MNRRAGLVFVLLVVVACGEGQGETTTAAPLPDPQRTEDTAMQLTSSAFTEGQMIPARYTCDGEDVSPPLEVDGIPDGTETLVLVMDDPDAPRGTWDHWVAYDIPVDTALPENVGPVGVSGVNSFGRTGYGGPCPPSGTHRYIFRVYALSARLGLAEGATKAAVLDAASGTVLADAQLIGLYGR